MDEYATRREKLAEHLANNSVAIILSAKIQYRSGDTEYPFRQNSDFYYLTGFDEPSAVMMLCKDGKGETSYILFNKANNPTMEIWIGKCAGQEEAVKKYGANEAFEIGEIDSLLPQRLLHKSTIYYGLGVDKELDQKIARWLHSAKKLAGKEAATPDNLANLLPILHELRLFKSPTEIEYMRKAAQISAEAHLKLMQVCESGQMEYQLAAVFNEYCQQAGCSDLAYNTIVGGGNNACTLHYTANNQMLRDGDLVLVDAGGSYNYYAADITRTFPVNGKFTTAQRHIYSLVLKAQLAGIEQVSPGNTWDQVQEVMVEIIVLGLIELGILMGDSKQLIRDKEYERFYMHSSGHWLGMDVHDVGKYRVNGKWRKFEPGMVLTVEPGIYISNTSSGVDDKWLGIGVRIEDDVLVTKRGNEVLSSYAIKQIEEIERAAL